MTTEVRAELGLQFTLHLATQYTIPELVHLARLGSHYGFQRIWINENFGYRHTLLTLGAIASDGGTDRLHLGVAITHPYARNPLDAAAAFSSLTELAAPRDLVVGLAIGDLFILGNTVEMFKPFQTVVETARFLNELWQGETVDFAEFPLLVDLYRLRADRSFKLSVTPQAPIALYCAGSARLVSQAMPYCDGMIIGGEFITMVEGGVLESHLRSISPPPEGRPFRKMCEINISVSRDRPAARRFAAKYVCHGIARQPDALLERLGLDLGRIASVRAAFAAGGTVEQVAELVSDDMIDAIFVAGTPGECRERVRRYLFEAAARDFDHVVLAKLGPDYEEALNLLGEELIPDVVG